MSYAEPRFRYTKIPDASEIAEVHELTYRPARKCSPPEELVNYIVALLLQKLAACSDSADKANAESFMYTYKHLLSLTDVNILYREVPMCLDVAKLAPRAENTKCVTTRR